MGSNRTVEMRVTSSGNLRNGRSGVNIWPGINGGGKANVVLSPANAVIEISVNGSCVDLRGKKVTYSDSW